MPSHDFRGTAMAVPRGVFDGRRDKGALPQKHSLVTRGYSESVERILEAVPARNALILRGFLRPKIGAWRLAAAREIIGHHWFSDAGGGNNFARSRKVVACQSALIGRILLKTGARSAPDVALRRVTRVITFIH